MISGCRDLQYWVRLKKLKLMSLRRRRERYSIIHVWKILNDHAPNDTGFEFKSHQRHGIKAEIPAMTKSAQLSVRTDYDKSFRVRAAQLQGITVLDSFKASCDNFALIWKSYDQ